MRSTDLVVDLPTKIDEPWKVIQANGLAGDSHGGPWVYCDDLIWNNDQPKTNGRQLVSSATARVVWVKDDASASAERWVDVGRTPRALSSSSMPEE